MGKSGQLNRHLTVIYKTALVIGAIWLCNVLFVASHEAGHALLASAFGANICGVYVSPLGIDGSTTHTILASPSAADLVEFAGAGATTLALAIAFFLRLELAVYVLALRTTECLLNYSPGSDMAALYAGIGANAYVLSAAFIGLIVLLGALTANRRLDILRREEAQRRLARAGMAAG